MEQNGSEAAFSKKRSCVASLQPSHLAILKHWAEAELDQTTTVGLAVLLDVSCGYSYCASATGGSKWWWIAMMEKSQT